jgi:hypothetical protein
MRLYKLMVLIFAERCDRPVGITRSAQMVWLDAYDVPSVWLPSEKQTLFAQFFDPAFPVTGDMCLRQVWGRLCPLPTPTNGRRIFPVAGLF